MLDNLTNNYKLKDKSKEETIKYEDLTSEKGKVYKNRKTNGTLTNYHTASFGFLFPKEKVG